MIPQVGEMLSQIGSAIAGLMVAYAMFQNYFPYELRGPIKRFTKKLTDFFYPYLQITIREYQGDSFERSTAYASIERYLNTYSTKQAKRLQANVVRDSEAIVLSMGDREEVTDEYQGIKLHWSSKVSSSNQQTLSYYHREDEKRSFNLTFHKRHRDIVINGYLKHVLDEGKAITVKERRRKLYTNSKSSQDGFSRKSMWSHVVFQHPATFDTLAMDPIKKQEIIDDLVTFTKAKDYYAKIGKAWKRGYLLYGPPGTGKSTMIAAMANLLKYDIYDLELTAVKDNTMLRKLLIDIPSKAIVVIEDIDCSLDLTGQREKVKDSQDDVVKKTGNPVEDEMKKMDKESKSSKVTLSGLLNFVDGLWSACGGERIVVFTTNYVEKLDPALIRRGRMDKRIELSYCGFEAFKALAKNYLGIESSGLYTKIKELLEDANMSPADVAENLMPKSVGENEESCLERLVDALEEAKEEQKKKQVEEEEKKIVEKEKDQEKKENSTKLITNGRLKENGVVKSVDGDLQNGVKVNGIC